MKYTRGFGLNGVLIAILIILTVGTAGIYVVKKTDFNNQEIENDITTILTDDIEEQNRLQTQRQEQVQQVLPTNDQETSSESIAITQQPEKSEPVVPVVSPEKTEAPTQQSKPPSESVLPLTIVKNLPSLPKVIKGAPSVNDVGTVSLNRQVSFFEKLLPIVYAQTTNRVFLYKFGSFPAQLFYYDLETGQQRKLTSDGKDIYSASILDQVNSVVYSIRNANSGVTLRIVYLDIPSLSKTISVNALGPINFSLGPDGRSFAYIEGDGVTNYLVVKDLNASLSEPGDIPEILRHPLPSGVTNVAELAWSPNGQSVYLLKRPNASGGPEAIIEFNLKDQSVNEIVGADSYKSLLSIPFADGRLLYLSLASLANPSGILVVEKNTNSGALYNHTETLGATNYLVAPGTKKIYFHAAVNSEDPPLANYNIVGFGKTNQEIILSGFPQCGGASCTQKFYSYNVSSKIVNEIFSTQFGRDTSIPSG